MHINNKFKIKILFLHFITNMETQIITDIKSKKSVNQIVH